MGGAASCSLLPLQAKPDIGTIFRDLGEEFLERERLNPDQIKVFRRIGECRTAAMGGDLWQCEACGRWLGVYHSCRDRHCPKCQAMKRYEWVQQRLDELLPVPYFHVVFTLPHFLNSLLFANQRATYRLLFQCASRTLMDFAADPKFLGAEAGFFMVLHTWGRQLNYHPHVHCILPAGGLATDRSRWISVPKDDFMFPVKALSKVFRGKYMEGLDSLWAHGLWAPPGLALSTEADWVAYKRKLAKRKKWVVYCKETFGGPAQVVRYLGQYTNRAAITNERICSYKPPSSKKAGRVSFLFKDYQDESRKRVVSLPAAAFARRFLLHVLPRGFQRIRHYGFLANCKKKETLSICKQHLGGAVIDLPEEETHVVENENNQHPDQEIRQCPFCRKDSLIPKKTLSLHDQKLARLLLRVGCTTFNDRRSRALLWDTS